MRDERDRERGRKRAEVREDWSESKSQSEGEDFSIQRKTKLHMGMVTGVSLSLLFLAAF